MKKTALFLIVTLILFSCKKQANTDPKALPDSYSNQATGASASAMLGAGEYTSMAIQIHYMPGYQLDTATITNVAGFLNSVCNKPGGITISQAQIAANGATLNPDLVEAIEKQNRTAYTKGNALAIYVLITDGYDSSAVTLGFAYRNTSICLFGKDIFAHSGGIGNPTRVCMESSVLEHELGHLMGLVNLGSAMQVNHQDAAHGNHCTNTKCLMYYATENHGFGIFPSNIVPPLDSNCKADLKANGGK